MLIKIYNVNFFLCFEVSFCTFEKEEESDVQIHHDYNSIKFLLNEFYVWVLDYMILLKVRHGELIKESIKQSPFVLILLLKSNLLLTTIIRQCEKDSTFLVRDIYTPSIIVSYFLHKKRVRNKLAPPSHSSGRLVHRCLQL